MRHPHRTLLFRLSALGGGLLLVLAVALVLLVRGAVHEVTQGFHDRNATLFRSSIQHMGDRMRSEIADVPVDLFAGDEAALRTYLKERATRVEENSVRATGAFTDYYRQHLDEEIDRRVTGIGAGLVGLVAALLLGHGLVLYALVVRPVRKLEEATQWIAEGDLTTHVDDTRTDEIGRLARGFNAMVDRLRASRDEITNWNRTLERRVEEARTKLGEAEKMASLGRMAGGIAHEFNNMLGGILGIAEEATHDDSLEEVRESLGVIARTAARAEVVTGNLLRFSRPRSDRPPEDVDLPALLHDALTLVTADATSRGIEIEADVPDELPLRARPEEIHQTILNLLLNAVQAMPDGGRLDLAARADGDRVEIRLTDTGVGIPAEELPHVFEPFFTSRRGTDEPGTGLGLAVVYAVVAAHGGTVRIASEPGEGTTATVSLPARGAGA